MNKGNLNIIFSNHILKYLPYHYTGVNDSYNNCEFPLSVFFYLKFLFKMSKNLRLLLHFYFSSYEVKKNKIFLLVFQNLFFILFSDYNPKSFIKSKNHYSYFIWLFFEILINFYSRFLSFLYNFFDFLLTFFFIFIFFYIFNFYCCYVLWFWR